MRRLKKTLIASVMALLILTQSVPAYAFEGIANVMTQEDGVFEEVSEDVSEGVSEEENSLEDTSEEEASDVNSEENSEETESEKDIESSEATSDEADASEEVSEEATEGIEETSETEESDEDAEAPSENDREGIVCDPIEWNDNIILEADVDDAINSGNLSLELKGTYHTETAQKILARLNEMRKEACDKGYIDPSTGEKLTPSDYDTEKGKMKKLTWSEDMEAIARLRAAEASVYLSHTRPNGESCLTLRTENGAVSRSENLAWNYDGLMHGIEQWYAEMDEYVEKGKTKETGHYASIISTKYNQIGVGCFYNDEKYAPYPYTVAMEMSYATNLDKTKDTTVGKTTVAIEFDGDFVTAIGIPEENIPFMLVGEKADVVCNATVNYKCPMYADVKRTITAPVDMGLTWSSSDESVATVNVAGAVTGKKAGVTTIKAVFDGLSTDIELEIFPEGTSPLVVKDLPKTTYLVSEKEDFKGAVVINRKNGKSAKLTDSDCKVTGFSTEKPGKVTIKVAFDKLETSFDILVLEVPKFNTDYGRTLRNIPMEENAYGTFNWEDSLDTVVNKVGENRFKVTFTPFDTVSFNIRKEIEAYVYAYRDLEAEWVSFPEVSYPYTGGYQEPRPIVVSDGDFVTLKQGTDYSIVAYSNHKEIGTADIILKGEGYYKGTKTAHFTITKGQIVITAKDVTLTVNDPLPTSYEYECTGMAQGDTFLVQPTLTCDIKDTSKTGIYQIVPSGADAGENYDITYVSGTLRVTKSPVFYDVYFDNCGVGEAIAPYIGTPVGETIEAPAVEAVEGYLFDGWYKDITYKNQWDFDADIICEDTTLYAKWLKERTGTTFYVQAIPDMVYTSKAIKPGVTVYDGDILLKPGKDYSVTYKNNTKANAAGIPAGDTFHSALPYVTITGKGNYTDKISVNFNILPATIGDKTEAENVTLNYKDQLVRSTSKAQDVFTSLKCIKKMKKGTDFTLTLTSVRAFNANGAMIPEGTAFADGKVPKGYSGSFLMKLEGIGNYTGTIEKEVRVAEKDKMLKSASIVIGANVKNPVFSGKPYTFIPAIYDETTKSYYKVINGSLEDPYTGKKVVVNPDDVYLVKLGDEYLIQDKDFTVSYANHEAVGTASLTIRGKGDYIGSKTIEFKISGAKFDKNTVDITGIENAVYTGKPITLEPSKVKVFFKTGENTSRELKWGRDFKVSYSKNINKGTATVQFIGLESSGFTGKVKKTFKITQVDIADITYVSRDKSMDDIQAVYSKAGVKPADQIILTNQAGKTLVEGVDYTLSYKNNKKVASKYEEKCPTIVVKGKGNYKGSFSVEFTILAGLLDSENISVKVNQVAFNIKKKDTYQYKPSVKVYDGKKALKAKSDYTVEYLNATQDKVREYFNKLNAGTATLEDMPCVRISAGSNGLYAGTVESVEIPIYLHKMESKNIYILVDTADTDYTGEQITPSIRVFYSENTSDVKRAKKTRNVEQILAYGLTELYEGVDYTVSYGTNVKAGSNKGSVSITGIPTEWGGTLTQKFTINKKEIR